MESKQEMDLRALDTEVSEKVMQIVWDGSRCRACGWPLAVAVEDGCTPESCSQRPYPARMADEPARYSTDIVAAMQVVEKLAAHNWRAHLGRGSISPLWTVELFQTNGNMIRREASQSDSLSEAICRAALAPLAQKES